MPGRPLLLFAEWLIGDLDRDARGPGRAQGVMVAIALAMPDTVDCERLGVLATISGGSRGEYGADLNAKVFGYKGISVGASYEEPEPAKYSDTYTGCVQQARDGWGGFFGNRKMEKSQLGACRDQYARTCPTCGTKL